MISTSKIEQLQRDAHNTSVANKILDMLDKLRLSSNANTPRRWIWELIQNAKDVVNSTGKIKIRVRFDAEAKMLEFSHNGAPFTSKHLVYLIEQVSTKEREEAEEGVEKKTGKFGTGFLTTHLLSTKVEISGIIMDEESAPQRFEILLDRSGKTKGELIDAIGKTLTQLGEGTQLTAFDECAYNTTFRYHLDDEGICVAKQGLEDLELSIPYVLAFLPQIEVIEVEPQNVSYRLVNEKAGKLERSHLYTIEKRIYSEVDKTYLFEITNGNVSIVVPIVGKDNVVCCDKIPDRLPKLFCEFPLVGTHDFSFPLVINSDAFNPTEPRDGVFLTDNANEKIEQNKSIIEAACELYNIFLCFAAKSGWGQLYNAIKVNDVAEKEWLSVSWLKEKTVKKCREIIKYATIIDTHSGERESIYCPILEEQQISIPKSSDEDIRIDIWSMAEEASIGYLPRKCEISEWYGAFWNECRDLSIRKLVEHIGLLGNVNSLREKLRTVTVEEFLTRLYALISKDKNLLSDIQNNTILIIPNQNGEFTRFSELYIDLGIDDEYKNALQFLGDDIRSRLVYCNIDISPFAIANKISIEECISSICSQLESISVNSPYYYQACFKVISLFSGSVDTRATEIFKIVHKLYGDKYETGYTEISTVSEELFEKALRKICTLVVDEISRAGSISKLADVILDTEDNALTFLSSVIDFLNMQKYDNYFERKASILPNQYGDFVSKDQLYLDNGIDETLKDLSEAVGYDIRRELLDTHIYLEFPENRNKCNLDLAPSIERFAKRIHKGEGVSSQSNRDFCRMLFLWIKDNPAESQKMFAELIENIHWLYDDEEIASNMRKAANVETLMAQLGIDSFDEFEKIVKNGIIRDEETASTEKSQISDDVLIQWGIASKEALEKAFSNRAFANEFCRDSSHHIERFEYVQRILKRAKDNIVSYLSTISEYDLSDLVPVAETTFLIKKNGQEIYLITRPSDGGEIRLFYDTEKDLLDYSKDWELWVEDGKNNPEKITFGRIIKLTGINRIPLRRLRGQHDRI